MSGLAKTIALLFTVTLAALWAGCASGITRFPECGDGARTADTEECDDGNVLAGDGCDPSCVVEPGYTCTDDLHTVCTPLCGDGLVVAQENCDGADLSGHSCETLELGVGQLACGPSCLFDTTACSATQCGNSTLDPTEECEGANLGGAICFDLGYDEGTLACTPQCAYDTTGCTLASCGDGAMTGIEECDDGNTSPGDGCTANCSVESGWTCAGTPSVCQQLCGNNTVDVGEECDGADLAGQTCETVNPAYVGGTLSCGATCDLDTSLCETTTCGNGSVDAGEQCDGVLLGGETCQTLGAYIGGNLYCSSNCAFDLSNCVPLVCGDGIVSTGEACDDGNSSTGDGCNALCQVESGWTCSGSPSTCTALCGNGLLDPGETCDGGLLGGQTCVTLGYDAGSLSCSSSCAYNTSGCVTYQCGNGVLEPGEQCDLTDLDGENCLSLGFDGGSLSCSGSCVFDTSSCLTASCPDGSCNGAETTCSCPQDCGSSCGDGCCNGSETAFSCPQDCGGCVGALVNGTCVYLANPNALTLNAAQAECSSLGVGWALCPSTILCDTQTLAYLGTTTCDCNLGGTHCACGSAANLYIHTGASAPHYIRTTLVSNCDWAGDACTVSGTESCGAALCCY